MHDRICVHQMCFAGASLTDYVVRCRQLGAQRIGFISPALLAAGGWQEARVALTANRAMANHAIAVETVAHVFRSGVLPRSDRELAASRDALLRVIDGAAELGARSVYMLTGGRGDLSWEQAAERFSEGIAPCIERAKAAGVRLAIENASALYADLHIAHSLADTIRLAELAGIGVCIELFFCWADAGLAELLARALPRCTLVQLSDYIYGDRRLPARAVPGDGAIPLQQIIETLLAAGYAGAFDLELLGPRIDAEGAEHAVARAAAHVGNILDLLQA